MFVSNSIGLTQFPSAGDYDLLVNGDLTIGANSIIPVFSTYQRIGNFITVTSKFTFIPTQIDPKIAFVALFNQGQFVNQDKASGSANVSLVTVPTGMDGSVKISSSSSASSIVFDFIVPDFDSIKVYEVQAVYSYSVAAISTFAFVSTWKTDNTGSSNPDQIQLPLSPTGNYNFIVNWGDGNNNIITSWDQSQTLHTYNTAGTYTVHIIGQCEGWAFRDNPGDNSKLIEISQWGNLKMGDGTLDGGYFYDTQYLNITAVDIPDLTGITSFKEAFSNSGITSIPNLSEWNTFSINDMSFCFENCTQFDGSGLQAWDLENVTTIESMFAGASLMNEVIGTWVTFSIENMDNAFNGAIGFNRDIGAWDIASLTSADGMFNGVTLSTDNYNSLLIGWSEQLVENGVIFSGGNSQYDGGGVAARAVLTGTYSWTITDGGPA